MELKYIFIICALVGFLVGFCFATAVTHDYFEKQAYNKIVTYYNDLQQEKNNYNFNLTGELNAIKIQ
jgi:hypothetical protein